jgi:hypothetical protein
LQSASVRRVSRYTTSGFLLGEALERHGVAPHVLENATEAQKDWRHVERNADVIPACRRGLARSKGKGDRQFFLEIARSL